MNKKLDQFLATRRRVMQGGAALGATSMLGGYAMAAPDTPINFIGMTTNAEEDSMSLTQKLLKLLFTEIPLISFISFIMIMELVYRTRKNWKEHSSN